MGKKRTSSSGVGKGIGQVYGASLGLMVGVARVAIDPHGKGMVLPGSTPIRDGMKAGAKFGGRAGEALENAVSSRPRSGSSSSSSSSSSGSGSSGGGGAVEAAGITVVTAAVATAAATGLSTARAGTRTKKLTFSQKLALIPKFVGGGYANSEHAPVDQQPGKRSAVPQQVHHHANHAERKKLTKLVRPTDASVVIHRVPIQTILGIENGVSACIKMSAQNMAEHRPDGHETNPCYAGMEHICSEALQMNLCCPCYIGLFILLRIFSAVFIAPMLLVGNVLAAVLLALPTIYLGYVHIVGKAKCVGPIAKFFIVILLPVVSFVAVVPILLLSLGNGIMIPFEYCMADSLMLMFSGPASLLTNGYTKRKKAFAFYHETELPYWDLPIWAPLCALLGFVLGLAFCAVSFLVVALCMSPIIWWSLTSSMWAESWDSVARKENRPPRDPNGSPCYQCCMCYVESAQDICLIGTFIFRVMMTLFFFIGVIFFIPIACVYGLATGGIAGAHAWYDPKDIIMAPWAITSKFAGDIVAYCHME